MRKTFRFENARLLDEGCRDVIRNNWSKSSGHNLQDRLSYCGSKLMAWGGDKFVRFGRRIKICRKKLNALKDKKR